MTTGIHTHRILINPNGYAGCIDLQSVEISEQTTCLDILDVMSNLLGFRSTSFVVVETDMGNDKEQVLSYQDRLYHQMRQWPTDGNLEFGIRAADMNDVVLCLKASSCQDNIDTEAYELIKQGLLPNLRIGEPDIDDLCAMQMVSQDKIMNLLKERFYKNKIYTYSGDILISVNPYKQLPMYNPKFAQLYQNRSKVELNPHIYAVADSAYSKIMKAAGDQCIVITGKSGSGKTQATHFIVHHILSLCHRRYMQGVEKMLSGVGPVLEALGNASTEHNNNSSRFGKFLRVYFYESGLLCGAEIQVYLLEKSRLVHQQQNESNFHIFYYMLYGMNDDELASLHLDRNAHYNYLRKNEPMKADEATDQLTLLREAMEIIGFFEGSQASIFKLCAAILLLGNITFRSKVGREEALEIENEDCLKSLSELLCLNVDDVRNCLLTRQAKAGQGERFVLSLKHGEAKATRDAMAKALYQNLFDWLVNNINMAFAQKTKDSSLRLQSQSIGLLDIFGFEDFDNNSFEQFCINYASEHLQNYCLKRTFRFEQELYQLEGLQWKEIEYADNSGRIALYEQKLTGLFYLIDDKLAFPGATDCSLLDRYNNLHSGNSYYEPTRTKEDAFIIRHFAGRVKYRIAGFHEKNHDQVREDVIQLVRTTRSCFLQEVTGRSPGAIFRWGILRAVVRGVSAFCDARKNPGSVKKLEYIPYPPKHLKIDNLQLVHKKLQARLTHQSTDFTTQPITQLVRGRRNGGGGGRNKKKVNSISQQYQASLSALMSALEGAHPFFVRCIQPNTEKVPGLIDDELMLHQLRCSGTMQAIQIQQTRFAANYTIEEFYYHYKVLLPSPPASLQEIAGFLDEILPPSFVKQHSGGNGRRDGKIYQLGNTQVFIHEPVCRFLRLNVRMKRVRMVVKVQAYTRAYLQRTKYRRWRQAAITIQAWYLRMVTVQRENSYYRLAATVIQSAWRKYKLRKEEPTQPVESTTNDE